MQGRIVLDEEVIRPRVVVDEVHADPWATVTGMAHRHPGDRVRLVAPIWPDEVDRILRTLP